jgi:hypothetical protein
MATTARGYPYPLSSDPVAQGATAIQNLAQAVNDKVGAAAMGTAVCALSASNISTATTVVFPAGRFTAVPLMFASSVQSLYAASVSSAVTTTSGTVYARRIDGTSVTANININWSALSV